jgi:hypothetical protein
MISPHLKTVRFWVQESTNRFGDYFPARHFPRLVNSDAGSDQWSLYDVTSQEIKNLKKA